MQRRISSVWVGNNITFYYYFFVMRKRGERLVIPM
jgi:hypothetical protein